MQIQSAPRPQLPKPLPQKQEPPQGSKPSRKDLDKAIEDLCFGGALGSAAFLGAAAYPSTYLHEMGHKMAIHALYSGAEANITVFPFKGGVTRWKGEGLSPLGEHLGAAGSRSVVAMAGTAMDALSSCALFASGYKLRKSHPLAGNAMMGYGLMRMTSSTLYAASGIGKTAATAKAGHDFVTLQTQLGVPCWVSTAVVASLIPLTYLAMRALEKE
ncbi:MAG: hypothetical protein J0I12_21225 [Candidatus Eremiobacteraeota bacterium]|nr:hypothetical protein [Candidatus Eremiobacteraeota bacterium]